MIRALYIGIMHVNKIHGLILLLVITLLSSCTSENIGNQNEIVSANLTGTWISTSIEETHDQLTMQNYTNIAYNTLYITESDTEIQISACETYNNPVYAPFTFVKENDTLKYVDFSGAPYSIISSSILKRDFVISDSTKITNYNQTLTKTSSTIELSRGSLQLNGPISANNQNHVCLVQRFGSDPAQGSEQKVMIPFDNDFLVLDIGISAPLLIGDYQYDSIQSGNSSVLYAFNVASNADSFWSLIGTNGLFPSLADLAISVSRPDLIEGNFSFISHNGDSYTGNFSAIPY